MLDHLYCLFPAHWEQIFGSFRKQLGASWTRLQVQPGSRKFGKRVDSVAPSSNPLCVVFVLLLKNIVDVEVADASLPYSSTPCLQ